MIAVLFLSAPAPSLSQNTSKADRLLAIARKNCQVKNYHGAIAIYNKVISENPNDGDVYFLRGVCLQLLDKSKLAAADFDRGFSLTSPKCGETYEGAANAYNDIHQPEKAMAMLDAGIKAYPISPLYRMKGQMLWQKGKHSDALACFEKAVQLKPKEYWNYSDRVGCLMETNNWKAALADLNIMVKLRPTEPRTYELRAKVYEKLGDAASAAKDRIKGKELGKDAWFEP